MREFGARRHPGDITETSFFRSVRLDPTAEREALLAQRVSVFSAALKRSRLPSDWREPWEGKQQSAYTQDPKFYRFMAGLDGASRIHLLWEMYQEARS